MIIKKIKTLIRKVYNRFLTACHPYNRQINVLNRKPTMICNQWFDDFFGNLFWPDRAKQIGLHGGLGDVILLLPFLKKYRTNYPRRFLRVIYTDVRTDEVAPEQYGLGKTRLEKGYEGELVNPIKDFLENVSFVDEIIGGDPTDAKEYWCPDKHFLKKWGRHPLPSEYSREFFQEIFTAKDRQIACNFRQKNNLLDKFVMTFHFRRGADKIAKVYNLVLGDEQMRPVVKCLLLGSSRNEILPQFDTSGQFDLTDNYTKGITLRVLYQIVMKADLFVGGLGSFEHFFWLARVPSINFVSKEVYIRNQQFAGTWIPEFWSENRFNEKIFYETAKPEDIFVRMIKPYFLEWLANRRKEH